MNTETCHLLAFYSVYFLLLLPLLCECVYVRCGLFLMFHPFGRQLLTAELLQCSEKARK